MLAWYVYTIKTQQWKKDDWHEEALAAAIELIRTRRKLQGYINLLQAPSLIQLLDEKCFVVWLIRASRTSIFILAKILGLSA